MAKYPHDLLWCPLQVTAGLVSYRFLPAGSGAHRKNRKLEISHEQKFQMVQYTVAHFQ